MTDVDALLRTALDAARIAGDELARRFHDRRTIAFKGGIDLVTDADTASERVLLGLLRERYPHHAILSEESGASGGLVPVASGGPAGSGDRARFRWIVDPLDGTTNYAHQLPHFSVSIAVEGEDGLLAGVVHDPMRGETFAAARGKGATLNGQPLRTSETTTLDRALLCTGFPYNVHQHPEGPMGLLQRFIRKAQGIRRFGSAALDLAYVAAGRFDGYFEFTLKPWDVAAGALLVQEAGGVIRRIDGEPYDTSVTDVLAATPGVADALLHESRTFLRELGWSPSPFRG